MAYMAPPFSAANRSRVSSLYRRFLKNSLDWNVDRIAWRGECLDIRAAFEANKSIADPRVLQEVIDAAEKRYESIRHPDPYISRWLVSPGIDPTDPTAPGGTKYERNVPPSLVSVFGFQQSLIALLQLEEPERDLWHEELQREDAEAGLWRQIAYLFGRPAK